LRTFGDGLDQGVPSVAAGALAQPLGCSASAFGAHVNCFFFSHKLHVNAKYCTKQQILDYLL
jgi:hypothetical protein